MRNPASNSFGRRILSVFFALIFFAPQAFAQGPSLETSDAYIKLSRQSENILLKELDLERYYIQYWIDAKKDPKFRRIRYFLAQQAAAGCSLGQNITLASEYGRHLSYPERNNDGTLKRAYSLAIVSGSTAATASSFELLSNAYTALQNKRKKRDPKTAANEFVRRVKEIDGLLLERNRTLAACPSGRLKDALAEEGNLLKHLRDWCVSDLIDIWSDVKSYQAGNSVFYALDATANWIIATSFMLTIKSVDRSSYSGPGTFLSIPADVILMVSAPLSTKVSTILSNRAKKKMGRMLNEEPHEMSNETDESLKRLDVLTKGLDDSSRIMTDTLAERIAVSRTWSNRCVDFIQDREEDLRHLEKVASQQNIAGPIIGACFLEQDVADTFAYYNYSTRSKQTINAVAFSGTLFALTGTTANLGLTTWNYISEIKHRRKLKRNHQDPEELLKGRLATIDQLESSLSAKLRQTP